MPHYLTRPQVNQHVRWLKKQGKWAHGIITSVIDDKYVMVDDKTGLKPRLMSIDRLDIMTERFAGSHGL